MFFFPNEEEVLRITGKSNLDDGLDKLAKVVPTLAVKLGGKGGLGRQGTKIVSAPAMPINVIDTTGAGDSFDAGFLFGYLSGYSLKNSLNLAIACGSLSTRGAGGTTTQPTLSEVKAAIQQHRDLFS